MDMLLFSTEKTDFPFFDFLFLGIALTLQTDALTVSPDEDVVLQSPGRDGRRAQNHITERRLLDIRDFVFTEKPANRTTQFWIFSPKN